MLRPFRLTRGVVGTLSALVLVAAGTHASAAEAPVAEGHTERGELEGGEFGPGAYIAPDADAATVARVEVDAARPLLSIPFRCGDTWRGSAWTGHDPARAIDFNLYSGGDTDLGKLVKTSGPGKVLATTLYGGRGYGQTVLIGHGNGYRSFYAHLKIGSVRVNVGDRVSKGQFIAKVGKSGFQSSAHLHYEQRHNSSVIPIKFGKSNWVEYPSVRSYKRTRQC